LECHHFCLSFVDIQSVDIYFISEGERCKMAFLAWVCGNQETGNTNISAEERAIIRRKMTSIKQNRKATAFLNTGAIIIMVAITFLIGFYA
jgi:3,4-dihydroxy-2-butanone 4-phosphate synthase